jgi:membrane fusion protein (multidrug efflux system)
VAIAQASDYGWYYWTTGRFEVSTDDAYVKADSTIIAPKVGGYLSEVLVRDNQPVKAGQVLAKIDDRDYVVALAQARADVAAAQGEIENISATVDHQQAVIAQAEHGRRR